MCAFTQSSMQSMELTQNYINNHVMQEKSFFKVKSNVVMHYINNHVMQEKSFFKVKSNVVMLANVNVELLMKFHP